MKALIFQGIFVISYDYKNKFLTSTQMIKLLHIWLSLQQHRIPFGSWHHATQLDQSHSLHRWGTSLSRPRSLRIQRSQSEACPPLARTLSVCRLLALCLSCTSPPCGAWISIGGRSQCMLKASHVKWIHIGLSYSVLLIAHTCQTLPKLHLYYTFTGGLNWTRI